MIFTPRLYRPSHLLLISALLPRHRVIQAFHPLHLPFLQAFLAFHLRHLRQPSSFLPHHGRALSFAHLLRFHRHLSYRFHVHAVAVPS